MVSQNTGAKHNHCQEISRLLLPIHFRNKGREFPAWKTAVHTRAEDVMDCSGYLQSLSHRDYLQKSSGVFHGKDTIVQDQTDDSESVQSQKGSYR